MAVMVTDAGLREGPAARDLLFRLRLTNPQPTTAWADSAYAELHLDTWAKTYLKLTFKTLSKPQGVKGFQVIPRRWRVERTIGWLMHSRRPARDHERLDQHSESLINWSAITLMTRRLTRKPTTKRQLHAPPTSGANWPLEHHGLQKQAATTHRPGRAGDAEGAAKRAAR
ncbi:transposase [Streptomyces sp. AN091965]|uniref:transposase n=1 Tax=Streptomyces sp. AN091965 TaxID=2927803 RepID=UPI001F608A87|nr:transposase [Streptomyces sp. AN091965]MCI3928140.1 transposase [Streptomyces sp. AN091965]